ncbi:PAS-domain containing protein [Rhizobium oryziradicis]|uniref:histidine kinase n=1 Tax=Rhizobium oryziradicis TaxID=1867956 RepID=A0A1Q8ZVA9_9HYPH|nr:histidine kinase [Rhizobium oryziradicis]
MRNYLEHILENLGQGIVLLDSRNVVTFFNSTVLEMIQPLKATLRTGMMGEVLLNAESYQSPRIEMRDGHIGFLEKLKEKYGIVLKKFEDSHKKTQDSDTSMSYAAYLEKQISRSFQFSLPDGRTISLACVPLQDGGWLLTYDDVSTLTRSQSNLARQNSRFDAALNNMPHGLCMFDADTKLILCNASYARMYRLPKRLTRPGTALADILAHRHQIGNGPANSARYFDVVAEAALKGMSASQNTVLEDGRVIKISHTPMQSGGYVATHENVTETVRMSEKLMEHRSELEATVRARTAEIERQAQELERMLDHERSINELQRQFVAMASHEFRTPLAIIDAAAQRLDRKKKDLTPEFASQKIEQIRTSVSRLVDLMESILAEGRLDSGKITIRHDACALAPLIKKCCDRQATIKNTHKFLLDIKHLPDFIEADRQALEQVVTNLLSNAVKYAPGAPDIRIAGWQEGETVKIAISDQGLGIDEDDIPQLFQRYFRARTSVGIAGTGLGLHLVKHIIELHQGSIAVSSTRGSGTTFTITLPVKAGGPSASVSSHIDAA